MIWLNYDYIAHKGIVPFLLKKKSKTQCKRDNNRTFSVDHTVFGNNKFGASISKSNEEEFMPGTPLVKSVKMRVDD